MSVSRVVSELEEVAATIDKLIATEPVRAVAVYETFLAGCHAKADELDNSSDSSLGNSPRIKARQATGADPDKTAFHAAYVGWTTTRTLSATKLKKMPRQLSTRQDWRPSRARFENPSRLPRRNRPVGSTCAGPRSCALSMLRNGTSRRISRWLSRTELKPEDYVAVAKLLVPRGQMRLCWVERGRALDREKQFRSTAAYDLDKLHRELLSGRGRGNEALEAAWAGSRKHASKFTYDDLMKLVPKTERTAWHEKALNSGSGADLQSRCLRR